MKSRVVMHVHICFSTRGIRIEFSLDSAAGRFSLFMEGFCIYKGEKIIESDPEGGIWANMGPSYGMYRMYT